PPAPGDASLRPFEPPEMAEGSSSRPLRPLPFQRVVERDLVTGEVVYTLSSDGGEFGGHSLARLEEIDLELGYTLRKRHRMAPFDPLTARSEIEQTALLRRGDWEVRLASTMSLAAAPRHLDFEAELRAHEGGDEVRVRRWQVKVPRRLF
ncbi:MAG: peptidase S15, partial [Thermoanaerobaculia bacterium]|nr:peptidase S15 [Thermoanaerobaculia bacterium]